VGEPRADVRYQRVMLRLRRVTLPAASTAVIVMGLKPRASGIGPAEKPSGGPSALPLPLLDDHVISRTATLSRAVPRIMIVLDEVPYTVE
jgi:hypothetical protein